MADTKKSDYDIEMTKFIGKEVIVKDTLGQEHEGICKGISHPHLNVVIMTKTEKIAIKNIVSIRRQRNYQG